VGLRLVLGFFFAHPKHHIAPRSCLAIQGNHQVLNSKYCHGQHRAFSYRPLTSNL
jgi:hypothetical protein